MEMYIIALAIIMGGFGCLLFVSEIIYNILVFIANKFDERSKRNE